MKSLIVFPLVVLIGIGLLSQTGLGTMNFSSENELYKTNYDGFFDAVGHQVCYENLTAVAGGEDGYFQHYWSLSGGFDKWINGTGTYTIYNTPNGVNQSSSSVSFSMNTSLGLIAVVIGILAVAAIVGLKILGSGVDTAGTILMITAFLAVWGVFSVLSLSLITAIPILGPVCYFFLTAMYTIGIFLRISGGGTD